MKEKRKFPKGQWIKIKKREGWIEDLVKRNETSEETNKVGGSGAMRKGSHSQGSSKQWVKKLDKANL